MAIWQNDWLPYRENERQRIGVNHLQRFPGQMIKETGLYDNTSESTEPHTGRYTQSDPIGLAGGIHTYAYVGGNPTMRINPMGLAAQAVLCPGGGLWGCVAVGAVTAAAICYTAMISGGDDTTSGAPYSPPVYSPNPNITGTPLPLTPMQNADNKKESDGEKDEIVYPDNTDTAEDDFERIRGKSAKINKKDGSFWDKDRTSHGGEQWKRWKNKKDYENGAKPNSIYSNGIIRK